ncbi:MAG: hypothetical protein GC151_09680 [Betaproteobacteria bacterium]|nr:hypothetical protein [Betaproteobacteria bacterium]
MNVRAGGTSRFSMARATHAIARLVLGTALVLPVALFLATPITRALLPAYRAAFATALGHAFEVTGVRLAHDGGHHVVRVDVRLANVAVVGEHVLYPEADATANASTPVANALHLPAVALLLAMAWPFAGWREWLSRCVIAVAVSVPLMLLDAPFVLAAALWGGIADVLAPGRLSPLLAWAAFVDGGGRFLLGACAGLLAVRVCGWHRA